MLYISDASLRYSAPFQSNATHKNPPHYPRTAEHFTNSSSIPQIQRSQQQQKRKKKKKKKKKKEKKRTSLKRLSARLFSLSGCQTQPVSRPIPTRRISNLRARK